MESVNILQEYANGLNNTPEAQTESSLNTEPVVQVQEEAKLESSAPVEVSNESAYEALLTGKTNIADTSYSEDAPADTEILTTTINTEDQSGMDDFVDEDDFIKTKTDGKYESWEQLIEAIDSKPVPKFENEMSESIYNMIAEGKINELAEILEAKQFAENIQTADDEDVLKAYIKINNPEFDDDDIESEYNESYVIDEYQFDESKYKREQKKLTQRMKSDVSNAKEFFDKLAQDITFPELSARTNEPAPVDTETDSMIQEQRSLYLESLQGVENRLGSLPFSWKDEKANVAINGKFDIPAQELTKYKTAAEDLETYQVNRYYQDGKYQADKLVKELYLVDNFDKIVTSAISQAVNQTRLEMLKQSKNIQTEQEPYGTFKPNAADEERNLFDQLFMGHLKR